MAGHFPSLQEAIDNVADRGTVYIGKNFDVDKLDNKTILISKSIELTSLKPHQYRIGFTAEGLTAINLNSPEYFKLNGITATAANGLVITGKSKNIQITNSIFSNCTAMEIKSPNSNMDITISDSEFNTSDIEVNMNNYLGSISFYNNKTLSPKYDSTGILLTNIDVKAYNNVFTDTIFKIVGSASVYGDVKYNTFTGTKGKIHITGEGSNIHFNENKIVKDIVDEVYYTGNTTIDFTKNWWSHRDGPTNTQIGGDGDLNSILNVNYSNWALFEDFSRFKDDPYTNSDLEAAIDELGQATNDYTWIFDFDNNGMIEIIDLVWLIRSIP